MTEPEAAEVSAEIFDRANVAVQREPDNYTDETFFRFTPETFAWRMFRKFYQNLGTAERASEDNEV